MRQPALGKLLATGRTSDVYGFGPDAVVKVARPDVPPQWAAAEAAYSRAIEPLRLPAPLVRSLVEIDGRPSIVFDRVHGPSMWERMCDDPAAAPELAVTLAQVQRRIHAAGPAEGILCLVQRTTRKIEDIEGLATDERESALALVDSMPRGAALLHGDLHPGNVLMSDDGPMVIDWFDAAIGHPVADVVRSAFLLDPRVCGERRDHLPNAPAGLLASVHEAYVEAIGDVVGVDPTVATNWQRLVALSRVAEGADDDPAALLHRWRTAPMSSA